MYPWRTRISISRSKSCIDALSRSEGLNRCCDSDAIFSHDVVLPAVMRAGVGLGLDPEVLRTLAADYIDNHLVVVREAADPSARYYTTKTILADEHAIGGALDAKAGRQGDAIAGEVVSAVINRQRNAPDSGQRELIRAICSSSQLVHGVGKAGAGKGFALDVAVQAIRAGRPDAEVVVTAVAAKRARELAQDVRADRSGSIESLHEQFRRGWRAGANTIVILDEAALANTFDMAKLLKVIGPKAKLVLIGDEKQGTAIGPAGWYGQELAKRPPVELTKVYRQRAESDRQMLDLIRNGRAPEALGELEARNRIHVVDKTNDLVATLAERYAVHRSSGRSVQDIAIVHQGSNHELDAFNRIIQLHRARHDEIDRTESYVVDEASTGRRWTICRGDRIVMNKGVMEGLSEPVRNGQTGTVVRVGADGAVRIRFDGQDKRTATIRLKPEMDVVPVGLGYVMSTTKYQGGQAPVVLITPGSPEIASQNSGYSQTTRMVEHVEVLLDKQRWDRGEGPIKTLGQAWSTPEVKTMASELLGEPKIECEYAPERVEHFEASLDIDTDDHDSVVLTDKEEPQEPANASSRRYRPAAADEAHRVPAKLFSLVKAHSFEDLAVGSAEAPAFGGDVGDAVYTEQAQDGVTEGGHEAGRAGCACLGGVLVHVVVADPVGGLGGGPVPAVEGEQVRGRGLGSAGGGEDQDGLAAGDGVAFLAGVRGVPLEQASLLHAGVLQSGGRAGDLEGAGLEAAAAGFEGGGGDRDLFPGDGVQGLVGAGLVAFDDEDDVSVAGQHPLR